uniref:Ribosomal lysine N-methyltransferase 4 n=1 Tax=Mycena chlorophos TaxID=658473 RepID=A0ABQ0LV82_MYCCL|nr:predicted protein [Mycena chlorophos]
MNAVLSWFATNGGKIDSASVGFTEFDGAGRGAVALRDIPEGHVLFKIPRSLILSTTTSALPRRVGLEQWRARGMHRGWAGLILCVMWETANGAASRWAPYLESLPSTFDTPMFWSEEDLEELRGTSVVEKLGKADAEKDFSEKVLPLVQSRPDIFPPETIPSFYTLEVYHIMGSRILSRSFDVERDEEEGEADVGNTSSGSAMDVDEPHAPEQEDGEGSSEDGEAEDEDEDDSIVVSMVPLADMLNARYECENAKLFYEKDSLGMMSTKPIKTGEQIWNTYGDLPNAELLRRYGHVDLVPLNESTDASTSDPSANPSALGNPGDVVEIRADLVLSVLDLPPQSEAKTKERIDWWLEQGGDDVLILDSDHTIPPALISLIRLLQLDDADWAKTVEKDKPPKPKLDAESMGVVIRVLERRLGEYPTTVDTDIALLLQTTNTELSLNKKHALAVRIGEKRILERTLEDARARVVAAAVAASSGNGKKRKAGEELEAERNTRTKTQRKR